MTNEKPNINKPPQEERWIACDEDGSWYWNTHNFKADDHGSK